MSEHQSTSSPKAVATFGGGCFWCIEAAFNAMQGVQSAISGYAGGHVPNPTYEQVCGKRTGHVEVVQVTYDTSVVSYRDLLEVFFTLHDPTQVDRQGNDVGPQYRTVIFAHDETQAAEARAMIAELTETKVFPGKIVTTVEPLPTFWPAEDYHQGYFLRNPHTGYCAAVVAPKLSKFRKKYAASLKAA